MMSGGNSKSQSKIFLFLYSVVCRGASLKLHKFNDFSCGSVKVTEELFCIFSARSGKKSLTSQVYTIQIKLLIQVYFPCL